MFVRDLRDADASCGGKAVGLARLMAAGLTVPDGFVLDDRAFRQIAGDIVIDDTSTVGHVLAEAAERIANATIDPKLEAEVRERARGLGKLLAVRSSATIEDGAAGAAAGVFSSRRAVPVADVWDAIRAVWTSALTPLAAAYARRRGGSIAIGVIVEEFIAGDRVTVYTRPPGDPDRDEVLVQHANRLARFRRADREPASSDLLALHHAAIIALRAERAIAAERGADVELVQQHVSHADDGVIQTWVVQARPIVHPSRRELSPPPPIVLAPLEDGRVWTWDLAHNPDPLSPAQAGLVERVERAQLGAYSLRVCAGFLYASRRDARDRVVTQPERAAHAAQPREVTASERGVPTAQEVTVLAARAVTLEAELEACLGATPPASISEAIDRYLAFYRIWAGELGPMISSARAVLPRALRAAGHADAEAIAAQLIGRRPSAVEVTLASASRGELDEREVISRLGALSPAWDVAVPTFGERPGLLRDAIARAAPGGPEAIRGLEAPVRTRSIEGQDAAVIHAQPIESPSVPIDPSAFEPQIALARAAADLGERDDVAFARAQRMIRYALLARAAELGLHDDDVFWLPLDELDRSIDADDAHRRASAARAAAKRASQWQMPVVVGGPARPPSTALRGVGTGARVTGRVVRFASLASAITVGSGDVVVTRAVTPALAVLVIGCAALVSETGGLLDHGAALARELGITCVVGCHDAWSRLDDGMLVSVDGAAGTVEVD
jgi:phosphohistidine swiveling domain-containing protein